MSGYDKIPQNASLKPIQFTAGASDEELKDFLQLLKLSKIGPMTYENLKDDGYYGISRQWLVDAKEFWLESYDWRRTEARINGLPQFTVNIQDGDDTIKVHFMALFSKNKDAVPVTLLHGWPGTFLEFLSVCEGLKSKFSPEELPIHVIVPSLPGYGYSSGPPLERNYTTEDQAKIIDELMTGLGFEDGYVSQGGDIGSFISRILGVKHPSCKAVHLNLCIGLSPPDGFEMKSLPEIEQKGLGRAQAFADLGNAYAREHGTRPGTIGLVLSSSPIALLAWVGEKFIEWSSPTTRPTMTEILDEATLYWLTDTFPRAIFPYRQFFGPKPTFYHNDPEYKIPDHVKFGYSYYPWELAPMPKAWVETTGNLTWFERHDDGGHFAALECPEVFTKDLLKFVEDVWNK